MTHIVKNRSGPRAMTENDWSLAVRARNSNQMIGSSILSLVFRATTDS